MQSTVRVPKKTYRIHSEHRTVFIIMREVSMRSLRWVGLIFSLLIVGVLGGLMAAIPAEAGTPTLTLDGITIPLEQEGTSASDNCPAASIHLAYNGTTDGQPLKADKTNGVSGCYSITGLKGSDTTTMTVGNWTLGNYSSGNKGRVLVNDSMGTDWMKATGITIRRTSIASSNSDTQTEVTSDTDDGGVDGTPCSINRGSPADCVVGVLTLKNTFDASGGQNVVATGTTGVVLKWGMSIGGSIDMGPFNNVPPLENAANDRFRMLGSGCEAHTSSTINSGCTPPDRAPSNSVGTGNLRVANGTFLKTNGTTTTIPPLERIQSAANPFLRGLGVVTSFGTTLDPVITADNTSNGANVPIMDTLCNSASSGTFKDKCVPSFRTDYILWLQGQDKVKISGTILTCAGTCNPDEEVTKPPKNVQLKCGPADEVGTFDNLCKVQIQTARQNEIDNCPGCAEPQMCEGSCILLTIHGTPAGKVVGKQIGFDASGEGVDDFQLDLDSNGFAQFTFSNLAAGPLIVRRFLVTSFAGLEMDTPVCSGGATCQALYDDNNANTKIGWDMFGTGGVHLHFH